MATTTKESKTDESSSAELPPDDQSSEGNSEESELKARIKELEKKVSTLTSDNTRLKNELKFTMAHQRRMSDEQVESLQRDVDALAARNEKLSSDLMQTEAELQSVRHARVQLDAEYSANITSQSTALVERLTTAQQEREKEIKKELKKALKWRDIVVKKMKDMDINLEDLIEDDELKENTDPMDKGLQDLMESFRSAKGPVDLQQKGSLLVKKVENIREDNQRRIQDHINFLKQEIEAALAKKLAMENEIGKLRRKLEMMETEFKLVEKQRVKTLQSQLHAAIKEKEKWEKRANKFEDTCETLQVLNSLQRSLSKEDEIKQKYEKKLEQCHTEILDRTEQLEKALQERNLCVRERNTLIQERNALALQAQQEYERAERFQRLVVVLRKKAHTSAGKSPSYDI